MRRFPIPTQGEGGEEWRPVVGLESRYLVSSRGRVRSLPRAVANGQFRRDGTAVKRLTPDRILVPQISQDGYARHVLATLEGSVTWTVHRMVCEAFHGPPPFPGALCRHLNDDKGNNGPANLAWGSFADNASDAVLNGRQVRGDRNGQAKLTEAQAREILSAGEGGESYASIARRHSLSAEWVSGICRGIHWRHLGRNFNSLPVGRVD